MWPRCRQSVLATPRMAGDKVETAINIAQSSKLFGRNQPVFEICRGAWHRRAASDDGFPVS